MSTTGVDAPQDAHPGPWYEMPDHSLTRCGSAWVSNHKDVDHAGIFQSRHRPPAAVLSPYYIDRVRRYQNEAIPTFDVDLINPHTGERIEIVRADAGGIAQVIHSRCGYQRAPLKAAIYSLLADFFWKTVDRRR